MDDAIPNSCPRPQDGGVRVEVEDQIGRWLDDGGALTDGPQSCRLPTKAPAAKLPVKSQLPGAGKFPKDPRSKPVTGPLDPGGYVYVQDADGVVNVLPQGAHLHPKVLGGGQPAAAGGEIIVDANGVVTEINNISGTFQHDACVLGAVKTALEKAGLKVAADALKPFSW